MSFYELDDLSLVRDYHIREEEADASDRRTGITLAEGKRDEHGMEEIEGMFSSPEKSSANGNWLDDVEDETTMGSDGMSLDEGRRFLSEAVGKVAMASG